jgi:hypothetical protein
MEIDDLELEAKIASKKTPIEDEDDEADDEDIQEEALGLLHESMMLLGTLCDADFSETITDRDRAAMLGVAERIRDFLIDNDD